MSMLLERLWAACDAGTDPAFSFQLHPEHRFTVRLGEGWPQDSIRRALALSESPAQNSGWVIYGATTTHVRVAEWLHQFPRNQHGQIALPEMRYVFAAYDATNHIFRLYDFSQKKAAIITAPDYDFPEWEQHTPFREFFHLWALEEGGMVLHSGTVCADDKALLLPGVGGSGKSTTVLSCLQAGLRTTGDDYNLLLEQDGYFNCQPLYANFKVKNASHYSFPVMDDWEKTTLSYADKTLLRPPTDAGFWQRSPARVIGVVKLQTGHDAPGMTHVRAAELLRQLAVSSIIQSPYYAVQFLSASGILAKRVESATLQLCSTLADNARFIKEWLSR